MQVGDALAVLEDVERRGAAGGQHVLGGAGLEAVEGHDRGAGQVVLVRGELGDTHAERLGDLGVGGDPAQRDGEGVARLVDLAGAAADRAARPVEAAQLVDDGAADAGGGIAGELHAPLGVEALGGLGEGHHAGGHEVLAGDVAGHAGGHVTHDVADQGEGLTHELVDVDGSGGSSGGGVSGEHDEFVGVRRVPLYLWSRI